MGVWVALVGGHSFLLVLALAWFGYSGQWPPLGSNAVRIIIDGIGLAAFAVLCVKTLERVLPQQMAVLDRVTRKFWGRLGIRLTWPVIIGLSLMAGFVEEVAFRGALQAALVSWSSWPVGLVAASLIFGLGHALSWYYFLFTLGVGLLLGGAYLIFGSLLSVIIAHILYDIWAFRRFRWQIEQQEPAETQS
ncbi:MAG: CPBP family intramembrane glutamic endopeptidase [Pseudomonadota bacterium]